MGVPNSSATFKFTIFLESNIAIGIFQRRHKSNRSFGLEYFCDNQTYCHSRPDQIEYFNSNTSAAIASDRIFQSPSDRTEYFSQDRMSNISVNIGSDRILQSQLTVEYFSQLWTKKNILVFGQEPIEHCLNDTDTISD